jgi:DNA invertase Pin-like site-specific DNA recombinase
MSSLLRRFPAPCPGASAKSPPFSVNLYAVKGDRQLTDSLQSKILAMAFSMAAEIERDLIAKRTKEAL